MYIIQEIEVSQGYRQGIGGYRIRHLDWNDSKNCVISVQFATFRPLFSTLATPLRHPCEGGGVAKLALCTNAYRSF